MLTRNGYIAPPARRRRQQHHDYTDHYHKSSWLDDSLMFNPGHRDDTNDSRLFLLTVLVTSHQPAVHWHLSRRPRPGPSHPAAVTVTPARSRSSESLTMTQTNMMSALSPLM